MKHVATAFCGALFFLIAGVGQAPGQEAAAEAPEVTEAPETPEGFASVRLGMTLDETRAALKEELSFDYRGEPEVSFLPRQERRLLEVQGRSFVRRGFFQFIDGRLYSIILDLNDDVLDHYGVYTQLTDKYGESTRLNPREIVWLFDDVRLTLERPLTVKYVDEVVYQRLLQEGAETESLREIVRDEFLRRF